MARFQPHNRKATKNPETFRLGSRPGKAESVTSRLCISTAQQIAPYLIEKLPLTGCRTLLDVGGGLGTLPRRFVVIILAFRATLVEHPNILPLARRAIRDSGMAKRVRLIGADFYTRCSATGDSIAVFVSNVLHAHGVAENRSLLTQLHRCLNPRGAIDPARCFHESDRDRARIGGALFPFRFFCTRP